MKYFCNPLNIEYKYQFNKSRGGISVSREAADPSLIFHNGRYYLFISMSCGFLYSDDLLKWKYWPLKNFPGYDYAPDARVVGDYFVLSASSHEYGRFYRTKDLFSDEFEVIEFPFPFWDPALYLDDDGRLYFYWGCGAKSPIFGLELDPESLQPISEKKELILCDEDLKGFERSGDNHAAIKPSPEEIEARLDEMNIPKDLRDGARHFFAGHPFNEGAWMTKYKGKYYLQYATPGTEYNVYCDAVYVSDGPLGDFVMAKNNPFSYKPGGFITGAGHGSTELDPNGRYWHISTIRISINHNFERRVGLWRSGFDETGELYCDQRYGDFPWRIDQEPWEKPDFMLLSYGKKAKASSYEESKPPEKAFDENIQTWWRAKTNNPGEWLEADLGELLDVRAIQVNFADDGLSLPLPEGREWVGGIYRERFIDEENQPTRWLLEGSTDGVDYFVIEDKREADTDLPHDFIQLEGGVKARFIKLTVISLPYSQPACVSGLRVFGLGGGDLPKAATNVEAAFSGELDKNVKWDGNATGYNVLWGFAPDKLYHSVMVFDTKAHIGGLVKGQPIYLRVDSFNESGITEGQTVKVL